jgi:excisionase family DNA binding protein
MPISLEPYAVSVTDAAKYLSISKRALSILIVEGKISARKFGKRTLVDLASARAYFESLPIKTNTGPIANAPQAGACAS